MIEFYADMYYVRIDLDIGKLDRHIHSELYVVLLNCLHKCT